MTEDQQTGRMKRITTGRSFPRREFITRTFAGTSLVALAPCHCFSATATDPIPIVVFSKIYQELKLTFEEAAALTAEAGLDGVDCPVRPGGEVLPDRATDELPRYLEALHKTRMAMPMVTTGITATATPSAEAVLLAAKKAGARYYRFGFNEKLTDVPLAKQLGEIKNNLKSLAALNAKIGITGMLQNHSPSGHPYIGGDLSELFELVKDFDPSQIGVAFDIGHALVVHGDGWREHFDRLKSHLAVAYVKDVKRAGGWVRFGEGDLAQTGYFKLLREMNYTAPISLHIEFDWNNRGQNKTRAALLDALKQSVTVLRKWLG
jgi:sugar phosphate isomerase/epimerase